MREADSFALSPTERATYGATVTAESLDTGETLTVARERMTAVAAIREICAALDEHPGRYRVVCISTPVTIQRDIYASRISLDGRHLGLVHSPEKGLLAQAGRRDMLHPSLDGPTHNNASVGARNHSSRPAA